MALFRHVERFPQTVLAEIETAALLVSPAALLEIKLLRESKRITVGPEEVLTALSRDIGLSLCPMPFYDVVRGSCEENWTRDPFDRLIVAHARAADGKLISKSIEGFAPRTTGLFGSDRLQRSPGRRAGRSGRESWVTKTGFPAMRISAERFWPEELSDMPRLIVADPVPRVWPE